MKHQNRILAALLSALMVGLPVLQAAPVELFAAAKNQATEELREIAVQPVVSASPIFVAAAENETLPETFPEITEATTPTEAAEQKLSVSAPFASLAHDTVPDDAVEDENGFVIADGVLYAYNGEIPEDGHLDIPEGIVEIGEEVFWYQDSLTSVTLPEGLKRIDSFALAYTGLKELVIPDGLEIIEDNAIDMCESLTTVTIPDSIVSIDIFNFQYVTTVIVAEGATTVNHYMMDAFEDSMLYVELPSTLTTIEAEAFLGNYNLRSIVIPDSVTSIGEEAFMFCVSLESVTLPAGMDTIPEGCFRSCWNLREINSDVENFKFSVFSFYECDKLSDPRFTLMDQNRSEFYATSETVQPNGLVYLHLNYQMNENVLEGTELRFTIEYPDEVEIVAGYGDLDMTPFLVGGLDGGCPNPLMFNTDQLSGSVTIVARVNAYGTHELYAYINYEFGGEGLVSEFDTIQISTPKVSISAPTVANSTGGVDSVSVYGLTVPGAEVTIYADGKAVGTATGNAKTGKYSVTVQLPGGKADGEAYELYAEAEGEQSDTIEVLYQPTSPVLEKVVMTYWQHENVMTDDITLAFTDGLQPFIFYDPTYPFQYDITLVNNDHAGAVYVTSTKGDDIKYLEAFWDVEKGCWTAYGFFDPDNQNYVPGEIGIYILAVTQTVIDAETGELLSLDKNLFQKMYNEESANSSNITELAEALIPSEILDNSTVETVWQSDDGMQLDIEISDGQTAVKTGLYASNKHSVYIDGEEISAEKIYENPGRYGFMRSSTVVKRDGKYYEYYIRYLTAEDVFCVTYQMYLDQEKESLTKDELAWLFGGYGYYTLEREIEMTLAVNEGRSTVIQSLTPLTRDSYKDTTVGAVVTNTNDASDIFGNLYEMAGELENMKFKSPTAAKNAKYWGKSFGKVGKAAGKASVVLGATLSGWDWCVRSDELEQGVLNGDPLALKLQKETNQQFWLEMSAIVGGVLAGVGLAALGLVGWPAIVAGAVLWGATYLISTPIRNRGDRIDKEIEAYKANPNHGIDPSGYIYEAIPENRIEGATVTIYYKDPDTGEEMLWDASDYDQMTPLITNVYGEYAWDVPEGQWRVKCELEGYETVYSEWLPVPPAQTEVNLALVSKLAPEVESVQLIDGVVQVKFSRYMEIDTINASSVTIYADGKEIACNITPVGSAAYANTFLITPESGVFSGSLEAAFTADCTGYNGLTLEAVTVDVAIPDEIVSLEVDRKAIVTAVGTETELTITAKPASVASGKKVTVKDSQGILTIGEAVFDQSGKAVLTVQLHAKGAYTITLGMEGSALTAEVTLLAVSPEAYANAELSGETEDNEDANMLGDVNGDGEIDASDAAAVLTEIALTGSGNSGAFTEKQSAAADINSDGKIDAADASVILVYVALVGAGEKNVKIENLV